MKRKKIMLILGGAVIILGGIIAAEMAVNRHVDSINNTDTEVVAIAPEDVQEVSWTYENNTLDFKKTDDTWHSSDDETFPVNQETMNTFLENFSSVHADFTIDDVEDYDQYGLQNPQCTLTITTSDGSTTIKMGDYSSMDSKRYITLDDGKVYLITDDLLESMTSNRDDFMQQDELGNFETVDEFKVSGENDLDIVYDEQSHSYSDNYHYFLNKDGSYKTLSDSLTETYESNITGLDLTDYVTYNANDEDKTKYGLDQPVMTIAISGQALSESSDETTEITDDTDDTDLTDSLYDTDTSDQTTDSASNTVSTEETDETIELIDKAYTLNIGKNDDNYYANVEGSSIIYNFDSEVYDALKEGSYSTLRPTEVVSLDYSKVDKITWKTDDQEYTVNVTHKDDEDTYKLNDKDVEFDDVITAINALTVNSFEDTKPEKELELSMTITVNACDNAASDVAASQDINLEIYQYNGDNCILVMNGENTGLIARDLVTDLKEALEKIVLNQA